MEQVEQWLARAITLAAQNAADGGRPFGAVLVRDGEVLAEGVNRIAATHDPSAHAELLAIRQACTALQTPRLDGAVMYASGQPCPMCLAAMHLAGVSRVYYAYSNEDGAAYGLSTAALYAELAKPLAEQSLPVHYRPVRPTGVDLYRGWAEGVRHA
ncbi:nucleoside deaminase [Crenobacter sp. SG2305]|uniref:nucleoside deaminase n=1 Tax=Crenobacter oryzisoli TaxID=3056844 RepID=UPI0025AADB0A|nr:nucleoside deaminase [Crenobacter sp. SG2305]MDN0083651.1 nucleoside deaminase [Crenobacter sp. SG2305]